MIPGGGGSSRGMLWKCGQTDRLPCTGMVARRGQKAVGCSHLGTLTGFQRRGVKTRQWPFIVSSVSWCIVIEGSSRFVSLPYALRMLNTICLVVKLQLILSLRTLKKHSTSGHSWMLRFSLFINDSPPVCPSILAISATRISLENPIYGPAKQCNKQLDGNCVYVPVDF